MLDPEALMDESLNAMQVRLGSILADSPEDAEFIKYAAEWSDIFTILRSATHFDAARKAQEVSLILKAIAEVTMNCIAQKCPHDDQHHFLARVYVMIQEVGKEQSDRIAQDLASTINITPQDIQDLFNLYGKD